MKQCKPWNGDVLEEVSRRGSGKNVGFVEDIEPKEIEEQSNAEEQQDEQEGPTPDSDEGLRDSSHWSTVERETSEEGENNGSDRDDN